MYLQNICSISVSELSQRNGVGGKILQTTNNFSHSERNLAKEFPVITASFEVSLKFKFKSYFTIHFREGTRRLMGTCPLLPEYDAPDHYLAGRQIQTYHFNVCIEFMIQGKTWPTLDLQL